MAARFINQHLLRFCEQEKITFSRTRPSRKNDNPYVEHKNYSVVRRAVGYARYEGERELELVNELYDRLRLQINFFKPVMKMVAKQRRGSRIWKKYDVPKTPYRRICESPEVAAKIKRQLAQEYEKLNPAQLARQIGWLQNCLLLKLTPEQKKRWEAGLDVKIFLLLQAAGVEQGVASSGWCFLPPLVQSLSDRFLMRHRIPLRIDFYVRQRAGV